MSDAINVDVGKEFYHRLANRDKKQGDGKYNAEDFRKKFLSFLDDPSKWIDDNLEIILDFSNVTKLGPSFANEAFAYFTKYAEPQRVLNKIKFLNVSDVKMLLIKNEIDSGYTKSWSKKMGI